MGLSQEEAACMMYSGLAVYLTTSYNELAINKRGNSKICKYCNKTVITTIIQLVIVDLYSIDSYIYDQATLQCLISTSNNFGIATS